MHPVLFFFRGRPVTTYLVLYTLAIIAGAAVILILSRREGLDLKEVLASIILVTLAAKFGAQLYAVGLSFFQNPNFFIKHPYRLFRIFRTGGTYHGAFIFGVTFAYFYLKWAFKEKFLNILDISFVGVALTQAIGRLGCFSAGCCYGRPTNLPWGVDFPHLGLRVHPMHGLRIHPTQLYESILDFLNFIILLSLYKRKKFKGQITGYYLINYGVIRFFLEYLRADGGRGYIIKAQSPLLSFSIPQLWSLLMISGGILILRFLPRQGKRS